jgi:ATP-dependent DNA ligase
VGARDQARRLSPDGPAHAGRHPHQDPARLRLDRPLSLIIEAASKLPATSFVIDGEGVILQPDGMSDFDRLHSRRHDDEVQLLRFDLIELEGLDVRTCRNLLRPSHDGIQYIEHIEAADGATVFKHACKLCLEGIVSKRRDSVYRSGRSRTWLTVKNPASPAAMRVEERSF